MSIVVSPPLPHQSFSDTEIYSSGSISAHAELSPPLPHAIPFPVFQHRHSSPYPLQQQQQQSFSALGPPTVDSPTKLLGVPLPAAPKTSPASLPVTSPDIYPQNQLPPTPDPSPPTSKVLSPTMMIKLAPPADDVPYEINQTDSNISSSHSSDNLRGQQDDNIPRRLPMISIDASGFSESLEATPPPRPRTKSQTEHTPTDKQVSPSDKLARPKSMGPPPRPRRSQTAHAHPAAVRMAESRSADSRARLRSTANLITRSSSGYGVATPSNLARTSSDAGPPLAIAGDMAPPDLGGPDGLEAKVVLLGSQGVGKTSLILRYTTRAFSPTPAAATIGSSLHARKLVHDGVRVKLQIWDTAGQERFRSMAPIYYRGAHVCVLVYDITDKQSFEDVRSWLEELAKTVPKETVIFVVGAKIDLARKRVVTLDHARETISSWLKPIPPPAPPPMLSPPSRSLFRSSASGSRPASFVGPTPSRSQSYTALTSPEVTSRFAPAVTPRSTETSVPKSAVSVPFPKAKTSPKPLPIKVPSNSIPPTVKIISSTSPTSPRRISFPALQSPTKPTSATFTDPISPSISSASSMSGHRTSGGRFSISGVLGMNRTTSLSNAASSLAQLAEMPSSPRQADSPVVPRTSQNAGTPTRVRVESTPLLSQYDVQAGRRKSEDWSSKSWRMGEGPGAAEALGEFGAGVKKKESAELPASGQLPMSAGVSGSGFKQQQQKQGRARGGSLGRDQRLYGPTDLEQQDEMWGVDVEGVRLGECSALTGEGVERLFKSITCLLVEKKDKLERERVLRRKNSVMLVDPKDGIKVGESRGRAGYGCCA